jgi:inner membrane protein
MPTVFSHVVAGLAIATTTRLGGSIGRLGLAGALCAAVPDLDVVGVWLGVPWGHVLGHRGITHSLPFAVALAAVVVAAAFRGDTWDGRRLGLGLALFAATASHGVLDAMTTGGSGVAFFAPFNDARYFLPWRPIPVSPISASRFLSERGLVIMQAEVLLIWLPAAILLLVTLGLQLRGRQR